MMLAWLTMSWFTKFWNGCQWITFWSKVGKYRTDAAKMIGMTPA